MSTEHSHNQFIIILLIAENIVRKGLQPTVSKDIKQFLMLTNH